MKKVCFLLALLLLLSGCSGEPEPARSTPSSTAGMLGAVDYKQEVIDKTKQVPAYTGQPLIEHEPDREVYIGLSNRNIDLYPGYGDLGDTFYILTKEHYNINQIQINVSSQTKYEVQINDWTDMCQSLSHSTDYNQSGLQDYQYLCLQGVSWQELAQEQLYAQTAFKLSAEATEVEDKKGYRAVADAYSSVMKAYEAQYQAITEADIPRLSVYEVNLTFTDLGSYAETIETVEVTIGDKTYTQQIGQWRLHKSIPPEIDWTFLPEGMDYYFGSTGAISESAFTGGIIRDSGFHFEARKDLTVTGLQALGIDAEVLGGSVQILKGNKNTASDYFWDGQQPLEFEAGTEVEITVYLRHKSFEEYEVSVSGCLIMNYTLGNQAHQATRPCTWNRHNNRFWDTYLMAFKGIDIGEYYACYYRPILESWFDELPEAWRK